MQQIPAKSLANSRRHHQPASRDSHFQSQRTPPGGCPIEACRSHSSCCLQPKANHNCPGAIQTLRESKGGTRRTPAAVMLFPTHCFSTQHGRKPPARRYSTQVPTLFPLQNAEAPQNIVGLQGWLGGTNTVGFVGLVESNRHCGALGLVGRNKHCRV